MTEIFLDALIDTLKIIPFLYLVYLLIEYTEHSHADKLSAALRKLGPFGSVGGSAKRRRAAGQHTAVRIFRRGFKSLHRAADKRGHAYLGIHRHQRRGYTYAYLEPEIRVGALEAYRDKNNHRADSRLYS